MEEKYMQMALDLAAKGKGWVAPNPLVGAVIVKNGKVIGQGYHEKYGGPHAEVKAIASATENVTGATMYITLEPCAHFGKTPPCANLLIEHNIHKVVISMLDPNPLVAGKGVAKLKEAGVEVVTGILEKQSRKLNEAFITHMVSKRPFVVLKAAMSLDGKIATAAGESQWISGTESRQRVHALRHELSGIMVGVETVIQDDPRLTARLPNSQHPVRIVVDSQLRIPLTAKVLQQNEANTIVAATEAADLVRKEALTKMGIEVIITKAKSGRVHLPELMAELGLRGINSLLLEGGGTLNFSALKAGIVDKVQVYIAPVLIGGQTAKTPVEGEGISALEEAFQMREWTVEKSGQDLLIEGYLK